MAVVKSLCACGNSRKAKSAVCRKCRYRGVKPPKVVQPLVASSKTPEGYEHLLKVWQANTKAGIVKPRPVFHGIAKGEAAKPDARYEPRKCPCGNSCKKGKVACRKCEAKPAEKKKRSRAKKDKPPKVDTWRGGPEERKKWYYETYLTSDWWRDRRRTKIEAGGGKCNRCRFEATLQVHHLSYKNLWKEPDCDLEVLCRPCHEREHGILPLDAETVPSA